MASSRKMVLPSSLRVSPAMKFVFASLLTILLSSFPSLSYEIPKSCNENEMTVVCMLKIQRNNSLDELAISEAGRRDALSRADVLSVWWKSYVTGIDEQAGW